VLTVCAVEQVSELLECTLGREVGWQDRVVEILVLNVYEAFQLRTGFASYLAYCGRYLGIL